MRKINLVTIKTRRLSEIFQSLDIKFAWVNHKFEEVSVPGKCRDFLGDCLWSKKTGNTAAIYGFVYDYKDKPFDDCRFSLKFPNDSARENFINNIYYLHDKEKQAGVKLSKVYKTQNKDTLVIEGSNHWINSTWKISLYTFYIKVMSYPTPSDVKSPENSYIEYLKDGKEEILLSKIKRLRTEYIPNNMGDAHNYMGFVSLIQGNAWCLETNKNKQLVFGAA